MVWKRGRMSGMHGGKEWVYKRANKEKQREKEE